jgi:hypothetical protein
MHIETPCRLSNVYIMLFEQAAHPAIMGVQGMENLLKSNCEISYCGGILDALQRQELCIQHLYVLWVNCKWRVA